jgi:hypothetical protein
MQEVQLRRNKEIKTFLFADDQVITAEHETLSQIRKYNIEI